MSGEDNDFFYPSDGIRDWVRLTADKYNIPERQIYIRAMKLYRLALEQQEQGGEVLLFDKEGYEGLKEGDNFEVRRMNHLGGIVSIDDILGELEDDKEEIHPETNLNLRERFMKAWHVFCDHDYVIRLNIYARKRRDIP